MTNSPFQSFIPVAEAIAGLLHPHGEVVIHDLKTETIMAIFSSFSKRKTGDESLLEEGHDFDQGPNVLGPYPKINWDGRKLKSITAVLRDEKGRAAGLVCINLDISVFDQFQNLAKAFLNTAELTEQPASLFEDDWREKINTYVDHYLRGKSKTLSGLLNAERKDLVLLLHKEGAFKGKNAAAYVGNILDLSRATVYNYLNKT